MPERPVDAEWLPVPERIDLEPRAGVRVWQWWGPRTVGFDSTYVQDCLVWSSGRARAPRSGDRRRAFFGPYGRSQGAVRLVPPGRGMLTGFVALADAPAAKVLAYARKFGPLGICPHGRPCTHTPFTSRRQLSPPATDLCAPCGWDGRGGVEPIAAWHAYARLAKTIQEVAAKLRSDRLPDATEWKVLRQGPSLGNVPSLKARRTVWPLLASALDQWIVDGDVRPWVTVSQAPWTPCAIIRLGSPWWLRTPSWPLFGVLGMALAQDAVGSSKAWCDGCGSLYDFRRWPRAGEYHYCPDCGRKAAVRDAQQRYRDKAVGRARVKGAGLRTGRRRLII
jgi:hypothetical protein